VAANAPPERGVEETSESAQGETLNLKAPARTTDRSVELEAGDLPPTQGLNALLDPLSIFPVSQVDQEIG